MLRVKDIMKRNVLVLSKEATIKDALDLMVENSAGSVIILENEKIVGIVTERDILRRVLSQSKSLDTKIKEVMTKNVITISPDEKIEKAAEIMTENKIKKLPVVDGNKLVGIITLTDIVASGVKLEDAILEELSKWFPLRHQTPVGG